LIVCTAHFDLYHLLLLHLSRPLSHFDLSDLLFLHPLVPPPPLFLFLSPRTSLCQSLPRILSLSLLLAAALSLSPPAYVSWHYNTLQIAATNCNILQHTAGHCNTLQHTATLCNTLQHTAPHCITLHHTATRMYVCAHICVCVCVCEYLRVYMYF